MIERSARLVEWPQSGKVRASENDTDHGGVAHRRQKVRRPRQAVVFIHGIFSSHCTFKTARALMGKNADLGNIDYYYFDYPFNDSIERNGRLLAESLEDEGFGADDRVALVAHSMGGLVSRFAILTKPLKFIRILFLLGTPNAGAMRLSQLSVLTQLAHQSTNYAFALFPRRSGIVSLSKVASLIEEQRASFKNAIDVDYVSIPGRFYHEDRSVWELPRRVDGASFSVLEGALLRTSLARIKRPHDGIVEESSNSLMQCPRGTEKQDSYGGPKGSRRATYAHVGLAVCSDLNHVEIHKDDVVIDVVSDLISRKFADKTNSAPVLENWYDNIPPDTRLDYGVEIAFRK
ncbi:hypothetical protein ASF69_21475 [Rhizobium sp. Leaf311]|uniref:lipase family alpha/beta hydrolase n=1 Tax=Rhizobium sp. Leaf311 TaxID=1736332 RepID=UPI0007137253|nr:alpha/beta hydrolase [Rhizobium sp. Leaf311]KQQ49121.1 hypothetical protein ASF69_21475 [Rhizobium sp. Leaf311]